MLTLISFITKGQTNGPEMADVMRSEGKIYVVIGVLSIIFVCIVLFLIYIERKLSKIEKEIRK